MKICHQLEDRLSEIEALIFKILNKHGIKDIFEVDEYFKTDKIAESDGWEDFFELDGLIPEKKELIEIRIVRSLKEEAFFRSTRHGHKKLTSFDDPKLYRIKKKIEL